MGVYVVIDSVTGVYVIGGTLTGAFYSWYFDRCILFVVL